MEYRLNVVIENENIQINHECDYLTAAGLFAQVGMFVRSYLNKTPVSDSFVESFEWFDWEEQKKVCIVYNDELQKVQVSVSGLSLPLAATYCDFVVHYLYNRVILHEQISDRN